MRSISTLGAILSWASLSWPRSSGRVAHFFPGGGALACFGAGVVFLAGASYPSSPSSTAASVLRFLLSWCESTTNLRENRSQMRPTVTPDTPPKKNTHRGSTCGILQESEGNPTIKHKRPKASSTRITRCDFDMRQMQETHSGRSDIDAQSSASSYKFSARVNGLARKNRAFF